MKKCKINPNCLAVLVAFLLFVSPNAIAGSSDGGTIKIAAAFAKTGKWSHWEKPFFDVLAFAADELNRKGGLTGKKVEIIEFDTQSTIAGAKLVGMRIVKSGAIATIGTSGTSSSKALGPILQKAGVLMITPIATGVGVTSPGDCIFRVCFIDPFQGAVMANFAANDLKVKTAVVLNNASSAYSEGLSDVFVEHFQKNGGVISHKEEYIQDTYDYREALEKIETFAPDVIFLPGLQKDSARVIKQARKMGITRTFLGGDAWSDFMYGIGGKAIEGNYFTNHWHRSAANKESVEFLEAYEKKHEKIVHPAFALAYDAIMILAQAIKKAQSDDPSAVRDVLAKTKNYPGVTGSITFDEKRNPVKPAVIMKFENNTSVYLKTVAP